MKKLKHLQKAKEKKMEKLTKCNKDKIKIYGWNETLDDTINAIKFLNNFKFISINTYEEHFEILCIRQKNVK